MKSLVFAVVLFLGPGAWAVDIPGDFEGRIAEMRTQDGKVYVRLADENSVAVYDCRTGELIGWATLHKIEEGRWELVSAPKRSIAPPRIFFASPQFSLSTSSGAKDYPSLDFDANGNFSATWTDLNGNDGSGEGVYAREFYGNGTAQGNEFIANDRRSQNQGNSSLGSASNGDYVIVWRDDNGYDGDRFGVFFRRFSNGGSPKDSSEIKAANTTAGNQKEPSMDVEPDGDFVIVWTGPWGGEKAVFARQFSVTGTAKGNEQIVDTSSEVYAPDVATNSSGRFVVVWRDGSDDRIRARVYNSNGSPITGVFKVSASSNNQFAPSVAMREDGAFIVTWQENAAGGIQMRIFDANGNAMTAVKPVSVIGDKDYAPSISAAPDGRFCIAWRDDALVLWTRVYNADGTPAGDEFTPAETPGDQLAPNCAMDANGNFVVAWKHRPGDGSGSIQGRRFEWNGTPSELTVSCTAAPENGSPPLQVQFTASATGGDGSYAYSWDFGDGSPPSKDQNPIHIYNSPGSYPAQVTVTSGNESASCSKTIQVEGSEVMVTSLTQPLANRPSTDMGLVIHGANFQEGATVSFGDPGIEVFQVRFIDSGRLRVRLNIHEEAFLGFHSVTVVNPDGSSGTGFHLFKVLVNGSYPIAYLTGLDPAFADPGDTITVQLNGGEFVNDPAAIQLDLGQGISVTSLTWLSKTSLAANLLIAADAFCGNRDVLFTQGDSVSQPCTECFSIGPGDLSVAEVIPSFLPAGTQNATVIIKGNKFNESTVAKIRGTTKISQQWIDCGTIELVISIDPGAEPGYRKVIVKNSSLEKAHRRDVFEIR